MFGVFNIRQFAKMAASAGFGAAAMFFLVNGSVAEDAAFETLYSQFYEKDNKYAQVIASSEQEFMAMDIEATLKGLDEDFVMFSITKEGPQETVRGIEATRSALGMTFGPGDWLGANVYKWGLTDNTLVQIESDHYRKQDGSLEVIKSLVVVEFRDGKRWREWRFKPENM